MRRPDGVKWVLLRFCWARFFLLPSRHCRHPSIRTLKSDFFARCKSGVLVSAGAATFHEKAGRSKVGSFAFLLGKVFSPAESPLSPSFHPHS